MYKPLPFRKSTRNAKKVSENFPGAGWNKLTVVVNLWMPVLLLSPSFALKHCELQSNNGELAFPIIPFAIVAYASLLCLTIFYGTVLKAFYTTWQAVFIYRRQITVCHNALCGSYQSCIEAVKIFNKFPTPKTNCGWEWSSLYDRLLPYCFANLGVPSSFLIDVRSYFCPSWSW